MLILFTDTPNCNFFIFYSFFYTFFTYVHLIFGSFLMYNWMHFSFFNLWTILFSYFAIYVCLALISILFSFLFYFFARSVVVFPFSPTFIFSFHFCISLFCYTFLTFHCQGVLVPGSSNVDIFFVESNQSET